MSSIQRITGTNSGLDVDTLVKQSLKPYQNRIDKETQNKKVYEYQQEQYKQIMSDASSFYDKYFDVLKTGNLISPSTYQTQTYKSTDDTKVTARGLAGASLDNYSINVTQLASKATASLNMGETTTKIIKIGTTEVSFDVVPNGVTTVSNYNNQIQKLKDSANSAITNASSTADDKIKAQKILSDLSSNVITAKYSEFNNNVTFIASQFGQGGFSILNSNTKEVEQSATDKYLEATIKNSSGKIYSISTADQKTSNYVTIDNVEFNLKGVSSSTTTATASAIDKAKQLTENDAGFEKIKNLNNLGDFSATLTDLVALSDADGTPTIGSDGTKTITKTTTDGTKKTETSADGNTITTTLKSPDGNTITTTKVEINGSTTTTTTTKAENIAGKIKTTTDTKSASTSFDSKTGITTTNMSVQEIVDDGTTKTTNSTATKSVKTADGATTTSKTTQKIDSDGATTTTVTNMTKKANEATDKINNITTKITIPYDGASPISKEIITDNSTSPASITTTTMLRAGKDTTVKEEVSSGGTTTIKTTARQTLADGSTSTTTETTVNGAVIDSSTTNLKVNSDGSTMKMVTQNGGTALGALTHLTDLVDGDSGTTTTTVNGITTITKTADGTTTITDGSTTTTKISDGTITTTASKAETDGTITTIKTTTSPDGRKTVTTTKQDGTSSTVTTKLNSDGSLITTKNGVTTTTTASNYTQTSLAGSTDVSALKDKIVGFVNDYNNLIKEINTKLWEKRDNDYMPLTDEQKKSMTESQITAWEKKAQTGLLRKDNILEKITREMKSAMSSVMPGTGLCLEKIGITPVDDYADKNGMFTIDEDKLTTALEENGGNVEDLFIISSDISSSQGIVRQLRGVLKSEFKSSTSDLAKKAGYDGSTTQTDNFLTKSITEKTSLIKQLNSKLSTKEDALYKKYSNLEVAMEQLNSQQSSLAKLLGQG